MKFFLIFIFFLISPHLFALSEGTYQVIVKKQQEKLSSRWSLADWFATQKKAALMDQWLALNSSTQYFEMSIYGSLNEVKLSGSSVSSLSANNGKEFGTTMYYRIFGLEGKLEEVPLIARDKNVLFGLRLLGKTDQGSRIKLLYGINEFKDFKLGESISQPIHGASISIYLLPFLGIDGGYRKYSSAKFKTSLTKMSGEMTEYGAFIDLFLLRFYIKQQVKNLYYIDRNLVGSKKTLKSNSIGTQLYF